MKTGQHSPVCPILIIKGKNAVGPFVLKCADQFLQRRHSSGDELISPEGLQLCPVSLIVFRDQIIDAYGGVTVTHVKSTACHKHKWLKSASGSAYWQDHPFLSTTWKKLEPVSPASCFPFPHVKFIISGHLKNDLCLWDHVPFFTLPLLPLFKWGPPQPHCRSVGEREPGRFDSIKQKL